MSTDTLLATETTTATDPTAEDTADAQRKAAEAAMLTEYFGSAEKAAAHHATAETQQPPTDTTVAPREGTNASAELCAPIRRFRCRHVFADGHQCGSPAMRKEEFCYYHHKTRRPKPREGKYSHIDSHEPFELPVIEDHASAMMAASQLMSRIASNDLDQVRAGRLFAGLRAVTALLRESRRAARAKAPNAAPPLVEEVVDDEEYGPIAPVSEMPEEKQEPQASVELSAAAPSAQKARCRTASRREAEPERPLPPREYTREEFRYLCTGAHNTGPNPWPRPDSVTGQDVEDYTAFVRAQAALADWHLARQYGARVCADTNSLT